LKYDRFSHLVKDLEFVAPELVKQITSFLNKIEEIFKEVE